MLQLEVHGGGGGCHGIRLLQHTVPPGAAQPEMLNMLPDVKLVSPFLVGLSAVPDRNVSVKPRFAPCCQLPRQDYLLAIARPERWKKAVSTSDVLPLPVIRGFPLFRGPAATGRCEQKGGTLQNSLRERLRELCWKLVIYMAVSLIDLD